MAAQRPGLTQALEPMPTMSYSPATKLVDLPSRLRTAILDCAPAEIEELDGWIHQPIPALQNRSVVALLADDASEGEQEVLALCNSIKGRS